MSPPPDDFFAVFPFDFIILTIVVLVVSFVLILEEEEAAQLEREEELQRFAVLVAATAQATTGASRGRDTNDEDCPLRLSSRKKRRYVAYHRARAKDAIEQDYLGGSPIFDA